MKKDPSLWVIVSTSGTHIIARPEVLVDSTLKAPSMYNRVNGGDNLVGLELEYNVYRYADSGKENRVYDNCQITFAAYRIDASAARQIAKSLGEIESALSKMTLEHGDAISPAQRIWRFARAIGAAGIAWEEDSTGQMYYESSAPNAQWHVDDLENHIVKEVI